MVDRSQNPNGRWHILATLQLIGTCALIAAVVVGTSTYLGEADERKKAREAATRAKHYLAWALINAARGASGEVGLRYALQDLNADHVSLAATPLSNAHLIDVRLPGADLAGADLSAANLSKAHLSRANLSRADLSRADRLKLTCPGQTCPKPICPKPTYSAPTYLEQTCRGPTSRRRHWRGPA
jgi:hypothetical protein